MASDYTTIDPKVIDELNEKISIDFIESIKKGDQQKYKDFFTALNLIKINIIKRLKSQEAKGVQASNAEMDLLYKFIDAKKKVHDVIYGQRYIKEEKHIMEVVQRKILELSGPKIKKVIYDKTRSNREEFQDKDRSSNGDGEEIPET